jgi:pimeloyl-ACP methyl ester carboxylesterase
MERSPARRPDREDRHGGLAYALWLPASGGLPQTPQPDLPPQKPRPNQPWPGIVIVHGAGSRKENHVDFARLATAAGWAALAFDLPGHGASEGEMSGDAVDDVIRMVHLLAAHEGVDPRRVAVRGSSLGGFLAIHAAAIAREIGGVIAICPAGEEHLSRGVRRSELKARIGDPLAFEAWLTAQDSRDAVAGIAGRPLLLMHAEGDIEILSDHSEELYEHAGEPRKLVIVPGGAHGSVQHDAELQGMALRWLERQLDRG